MAIYTIGHSTRTLEELVEILKVYSIERLVDVRTMPRSRHTPQFNAENLANSLKRNGINYFHLDTLGGLRKTSKDSINKGWRNTSFRGYADYMQTEDFKRGLSELMELAVVPTAIMCAEAVPWRCHRSLIGDALLVRGIEVIDIFSETKSVPEKLTSFAQTEGLTITYSLVD